LSPPSARRAYPVLAVLALAAVAVPAVPAAAQGRRHPPEEAVERYRVAYDHYKSGRYREAIVELEAALALDPESPTLVYNLARVHELLGELDEALRYYRLYEGRLPRGERREQARIRRAIERIEGALSTSPADPEALTEPDWPGPPLEEPPPRRVRGVADAAVWVTGWTGLALLATGAVLGVLALDARRDVETFVLGLDGDLGKRQDREDRAQRLSLAADLTLGLGAAAVVGAVLLYALRTREEPADDRAAGRLRVDLVLDPRGQGGVLVSLAGTWP